MPPERSRAESPSQAPGVALDADLRLVVTDHRGRVSTGTVRSGDGGLVLDVDDATVLLASLPRRPGRGTTDRVVDVLGRSATATLRRRGRDLATLDASGRSFTGQLAGDPRLRLTPYGLVTAGRVRWPYGGILAAAAAVVAVLVANRARHRRGR